MSIIRIKHEVSGFCAKIPVVQTIGIDVLTEPQLNLAPEIQTLTKITLKIGIKPWNFSYRVSQTN